MTFQDDYGYGVKGWRGVGWSSEKETYSRYEQFSNELEEGEIILDVGCGNGLFYEYLMMVKPYLDIDYYGIDVSESFLNEFVRRFPEMEFKLIQGNFLEEPLRSTFDVIVAIGLTSDFDLDKKYEDLRKFIEKAISLAEKKIIFDCLLETSDDRYAKKGVDPTKYDPVKVFSLLRNYSNNWVITFKEPVVFEDFMFIMKKK
jgi:SAM-dependent methyltransferase